MEPTRCPMAMYEFSDEENGGSDSEGSYQTPSPLDRSCAPDPDYDPIDEITPWQSSRCQFAEEATTSSVLSEQLSMPTWSSEPKGNKRRRRRNNLSKSIYVVTGVNKFGAPIEPAGINARWRNACGAIAREKCKIIWDNWKDVDDAVKDLLWDEMKQRYLFPPEMQEVGKKATIITIGRCLRTFRCNLNKDYIKKGLTPFAHFSFITPEEWRIFVGQKTTERALALSKEFSNLSKKNKFSHNLGPGGYQAKIVKWRKKEEEDRKAGKLDELDGCSDRTRNWILGRCGVTKDGQLVPKNSEVCEVVERAKDIAAKEKEGKFKPKRQNDQLTAALGTEEHRGRIRAISSMASWKLGFPDDASSDRNHEQLKEDIVKEYHEKWKQNFFQFMKENPQYIQPMPVPEVRLNLVCEQQISTQNLAPSSTTSVDKNKCQLDSITERTPCSLHVPVGRKGRTVEVAKGIAMPCRIFHNTPIPTECAKVLVLEVALEKYNNEELDYPLPNEGIETLQDAVNNFILWHRQDIIPYTQSPEICLNLVCEQQISTQNLARSSTSSVDKNKCQLDSITERTPCSLHVPVGRKGRTVEVAKGIVMPCRIFYNIPIPAECVKVLVLEVVHEKYNNEELDYPLPNEGIETLGDALNNFVLWHRRDIIPHTHSPVVATH